MSEDREVSIEVEEATEASGGFIRYQHVERLNHQECEGLLDGVVHVFFKVDGTDAFIEKEKSKLTLPNDGVFENRMIPELLGRVWYEFIREETTEFLKEFKNPKVNFQLLQKMAQRKVKQALVLQG